MGDKGNSRRQLVYSPKVVSKDRDHEPLMNHPETHEADETANASLNNFQRRPGPGPSMLASVTTPDEPTTPAMEDPDIVRPSTPAFQRPRLVIDTRTSNAEISPVSPISPDTPFSIGDSPKSAPATPLLGFLPPSPYNPVPPVQETSFQSSGSSKWLTYVPPLPFNDAPAAQKLMAERRALNKNKAFLKVRLHPLIDPAINPLTKFRGGQGINKGAFMAAIRSVPQGTVITEEQIYKALRELLPRSRAFMQMKALLSHSDLKLRQILPLVTGLRRTVEDYESALEKSSTYASKLEGAMKGEPGSETAVEVLQEQMQRERTDVEKLQNEFYKVSAELQEEREKRRDYQMEFRYWKGLAENAKLRKEVDGGIMDDLVKCQQQLEEKTNMLELKDNAIFSLEEQVKELQEENEIFTKEDSKASEIERLKQELTKCRENGKQLSRQAEEDKSTIQQLRGTIQELNEEAVDLRAQVKKFKNENRPSTISRIPRLRSHKSSPSPKVRRLSPKQTRNRGDDEDLLREIEDLKIERKKNQISKASKVKKLEAELTNYQAYGKELQEQLADADNVIDEVQKVIENQESENQDLKSINIELKKANAGLRELENKLTKCHQHGEKLEKDGREQEDIIYMLTEKADEYYREKREQELQRDRFITRYNERVLEIEALERKVLRLDSQVSALSYRAPTADAQCQTEFPMADAQTQTDLPMTDVQAQAALERDSLREQLNITSATLKNTEAEFLAYTHAVNEQLIDHLVMQQKLGEKEVSHRKLLRLAQEMYEALRERTQQLDECEDRLDLAQREVKAAESRASPHYSYGSSLDKTTASYTSSHIEEMWGRGDPNRWRRRTPSPEPDSDTTPIHYTNPFSPHHPTDDWDNSPPSSFSPTSACSYHDISPSSSPPAPHRHLRTRSGTPEPLPSGPPLRPTNPDPDPTSSPSPSPSPKSQPQPLPIRKTPPPLPPRRNQAAPLRTTKDPLPTSPRLNSPFSLTPFLLSPHSPISPHLFGDVPISAEDLRASWSPRRRARERARHPLDPFADFSWYGGDPLPVVVYTQGEDEQGFGVKGLGIQRLGSLRMPEKVPWEERERGGRLCRWVEEWFGECGDGEGGGDGGWDGYGEDEWDGYRYGDEEVEVVEPRFEWVEEEHTGPRWTFCQLSDMETAHLGGYFFREWRRRRTV